MGCYKFIYVLQEEMSIKQVRKKVLPSNKIGDQVRDRGRRCLFPSGACIKKVFINTREKGARSETSKISLAYFVNVFILTSQLFCGLGFVYSFKLSSISNGTSMAHNQEVLFSPGPRKWAYYGFIIFLSCQQFTFSPSSVELNESICTF